MQLKHLVNTIKENKANVFLTVFFGASMLHMWVGILSIPVEHNKWIVVFVSIVGYQSLRFFASGMAELECIYRRKVIQEELDTEKAMRLMAGEKY